MNSVRTKTWIGAIALVLGSAGACNGRVSMGGSETNWLGDCASDDDCSVGQCLCGVCSQRCDRDDPCPPGLDTCAGHGSAAFARFCGAGMPNMTGVCAKGCGDGVPCASGFQCETGVCVPAPEGGGNDDAGTGDRAEASSVGQGGSSSSGKLGDPCIPQDESKPLFSGFAETEVNVESQSPSCSTGICLVANFRGRVTCAYGQRENGMIGANGVPEVDPAQQRCVTAGPNPVPVEVPVRPQLIARPPESSVYCSCRCDGPAGSGPFCACPSGFECASLVGDYGTSSGAQLAGSYCIKAGTGVPDPTKLPQAECGVSGVVPRPLGCGPL